MDEPGSSRSVCLFVLLLMLLCACAIFFCYGEHLPNTGLQPEQCETTSGNFPPRVLSEVLACMYIPVDVLVALLKAIVAKSSLVSVLDMFIGGPCEEEACGRRGSCGVNAGLVCVFSCFCFVVCFVCSPCDDLCFLFRSQLTAVNLSRLSNAWTPLLNRYFQHLCLYCIRSRACWCGASTPVLRHPGLYDFCTS